MMMCYYFYIEGVVDWALQGFNFSCEIGIAAVRVVALVRDNRSCKVLSVLQVVTILNSQPLEIETGILQTILARLESTMLACEHVSMSLRAVSGDYVSLL